MIVGNRIEVMHGVNLDQLGRRDPEHYGTLTLGELQMRIAQDAAALGLTVSFFATNDEKEFVEHLHRVADTADGIVLNAGAWTHYAWSLHDALAVGGVPAVEVHLSDVMAREPWRHVSVFEGLRLAAVSGKGPDGYREALGILAEHLQAREEAQA